MKNMRSFSTATFSVLLLLSTAPVVALNEDPGMEFPGNQNAAQNREFVTQSIESAQAAYKENAPKVEAFIKTEYKNAKDSITNFLFGKNQAATIETASSSVNSTVATPSITQVEAPIPVNPDFSLKNLFTQVTEVVKNQGSQLKEAVKAHPGITAVVLATAVAIPLAIYGLKKAKKINGNTHTLKTAAIVAGMVASVAIPVAIAYNNPSSDSAIKA